MSLLRKLLPAFIGTTLLAGTCAQALAADPDSCNKVKIGAGDWPDIQITSSMMSDIVGALGYEPDVKTLAIPVIFASLKNKDLDVWQGNWMPSMVSEIQPYLDDKSVEVIQTNLTGATSSIGVPRYVADAGVKSFNDLAKFKDKFGGKIYGFEAGNDVNRHVQQLIEDPKNHLEGWEVVESSEAGMVTQAEQAIKNKEWIVFVPYTPHAAMGKMDLWFLTDIPDASFGEATVYTNARAGYLQECPNVGQFFKNVTFSIPMLNDVLDKLASSGEKPEDIALQWMKQHTADMKPWLAGITTRDGKDGFEAVSAAIAAK